MAIPKTKGYTEIVKIIEAALNGDIEKAHKYVDRFIIKYPESDLIYPITHILANNNNPSQIGHGNILSGSLPDYVKYLQEKLVNWHVAYNDFERWKERQTDH